MDLDVVVSADSIAIGERSGDRAVLFEGANAEVDRGRRVPDSYLGRVRCRSLIYGLVEREAREQRRALPNRFVERAVDDDVGFNSRRCDGDLAGTPVMYRRGRGRELKGGENCKNGGWG